MFTSFIFFLHDYIKRLTNKLIPYFRLEQHKLLCNFLRMILGMSMIHCFSNKLCLFLYLRSVVEMKSDHLQVRQIYTKSMFCVLSCDLCDNYVINNQWAMLSCIPFAHVEMQNKMGLVLLR